VHRPNHVSRLVEVLGTNLNVLRVAVREPNYGLKLLIWITERHYCSPTNLSGAGIHQMNEKSVALHAGRMGSH
jgi:hypothetical protein